MSHQLVVGWYKYNIHILCSVEGSMAELKSGITVVLGGQWGDEGKGKLVDILAQEADVVARCQVRQSYTCLANASCHVRFCRKFRTLPLINGRC